VRCGDPAGGAREPRLRARAVARLPGARAPQGARPARGGARRVPFHPERPFSSSGTQAANAGAAGASPLNEPCPGVRPGGVSRKDKSSRRSDAQSASTRSRASPFRSAPIHRYTATLESVSRTRYVFAGSERRYRERYTEPLGPRATSPPRPSASALLAFSDRRGYSLPSHAHRVAECGKCDRDEDGSGRFENGGPRHSRTIRTKGRAGPGTFAGARSCRVRAFEASRRSV
jgi:hypothetical protein